jgi:hypothetical protein
MTKKKTKPMTGDELYKIDKLPYMIYLEAALTSAEKQNASFLELRKVFHEMFVAKSLEDLGYGKKSM